MNLYQITNAFPSLLEQEEMSEEDKKIVEEELTKLLEEKSQNIIGYCRNIESTIEAMKNEEKRLSDQRKVLENRIDNFKKYVKDCMEQNGFIKIETGIGTLSIQKSPISVTILNEDLIPSEYKQEIKTTKIDKKAIADNFKSTGEIPEGTEIQTNNTYLRIK